MSIMITAFPNQTPKCTINKRIKIQCYGVAITNLRQWPLKVDAVTKKNTELVHARDKFHKMKGYYVNCQYVVILFKLFVLEAFHLCM